RGALAARGLSAAHRDRGVAIAPAARAGALPDLLLLDGLRGRVPGPPLGDRRGPGALLLRGGHGAGARRRGEVRRHRRGERGGRGRAPGGARVGRRGTLSVGRGTLSGVPQVGYDVTTRWGGATPAQGRSTPAWSRRARGRRASPSPAPLPPPSPSPGE